MKRVVAGAAAAVASALIWFAICRATGQAEAWDAPAYWQVALPALGLLTAFLGFLTRTGYFERGIAASLGQLAGLLATGEGGAMWPIGVGFLVVLALPLGFAGWLGGKVRGGCSRTGRRCLGRQLDP